MLVGGGVRYVPDGTPFDEAASSMQKCIRRALVGDACYWADQLFARYPHYVWKRLAVIVVEDIGMANTLVVQEMLAARAAFYAGGEMKFGPTDPVSFTRGRMMLMQVVSDMARSPKSRDADQMVHDCLRTMRIGEGVPLSTPGQSFDVQFANVVAALDACNERQAYYDGHVVADGYAGWLWQGLHEYAFAQVGLGHVVQIVGLVRDVVEAFLIQRGGYEAVFMSFVIQLLCRTPRDTRNLDMMSGLDVKREVPDCAIDMHTRRGRSMGRNLIDFRDEGSFVTPLAYESDYVFFDPVHGAAATLPDGTALPEPPRPNMKKQQAEQRSGARQGGLF